MPVAVGYQRDRQYRVAVWATGIAGVRGSDQWLLTSPGFNLLPGVIESPDFFHRAWPQPRIPASNRTHLHRGVFYEGFDTIYADPGQVPVYDWIVPKGRKRPIEHRTWIDGGLQDVLLGQDTIYGAAGEAPVYDWPVPRGYPVPWEHKTYIDSGVNDVLLGQDTIYGEPGQAPVYENPLPPRGRKHGIDLKTWLRDYLNTTLLGQDTFYGAPGQSPVPENALPPKGRRYPVELRTWLRDYLLTTLQEQDVMYGDPGQVPTHDLILPRRKRRPTQLEQRGTLNTNLLVVAQILMRLLKGVGL